MVVFADYQAFNFGGKIQVVKELAIFDTSKKAPENFLFKPPEDLSFLSDRYQKRENLFTSNCQGFCWSSGTIEYKKLTETLIDSTKNLKCIYVKGEDKKCWFSKRLPECFVVNIKEFGCPSFRKLRKKFERIVSCENHYIRNPVCALENVQNLANWYNEYCTTQKMSQLDVECEGTSCSCLCL